MPLPDAAPLFAFFRSRITRRSLLLGAGAGAIGIGVSRSVAGSDDDHDRDDHDRDDDHVRPSGTVPVGSAEVVIDDDDADGFKPGRIAIEMGQSVTWVNLDDDPHTATGLDFDTGVLQPGDLATIRFEVPGSYAYSCQLHPVMTGVVEVRDESGALLAASPIASPAASPAATPGGLAEVGIDNLAFAPDDIQVAPGTTVRWTNLEAIPHTVRLSSGNFDSGIMQQGDTFEHTFSTEGVFDYICGLHPSMTGRVMVEM